MLMAVVAALIIGGVFAFVILRNRRAATEAAAWPSAPGRITNSEVMTRRRDGELSHEPHVAYAFDVDGRTYTGNRVRFGLTRYGLAPSKKVCARYPVGSSVPVFYDPAEPSRNVLEREGKA